MDAFLFHVRRFAGWILGVVGGVLSFLSSWDLVEDAKFDQTTLSIMANTFIYITVILLLIFVITLYYNSSRKEKYANITTSIHNINHHIRDLNNYLIENRPSDDASIQEYNSYLSQSKTYISHILDFSADIFRSLTSTNCRTSIKLTYENNGELYFYTYARDSASAGRYRDRDRKRVRDNHDPLNKNKRFAQLFSSDESHWHYFSNNLSKDSEFQTTSMTAYKPELTTGLNSHRKRFSMFNWPLPYRSTISCVIRQGSCNLMEERDSEVLGFLTVDSESRGVFIEKWDTQIVFAVADAIFTPLKQVIKIQAIVNSMQNQDKKNGIPSPT
ncbi:hypothetical protein [Thalassospira permensis]|nr:hypothetical protein [Thalassospira permensis]